MKKQELIITYIDPNHISTDFGNTRKRFPQGSIDELASTIKREGILSPITVRPDADGYQLICGERRLRSMIKLKWKEVPCIVRELSDQEARQVQIIENCQREDVHPLEERDAFLELMLSGTKIKDISVQIGKSETYVSARVNLQNLSPDIERYFYENEIEFSHALEFSKLTYPDQQKVFDKCVEIEDGKIVDIMTVRDLRSYVFNNVTLNLVRAIFALDDDKLLADVPACTKCPKRAGCNVNLFGEVEPDTCFDAACFQNKKQAHIDKVCTGLQKEGKEVLRLSSKYDNDTAKKNGFDGGSDHYQLVGPDSKDFDKVETNSYAVIVDDWIEARLGSIWKVDHRPKKKVKAKKSDDDNEIDDTDKFNELLTESVNEMRTKIAEKIGQSKAVTFPLPMIKLIGSIYWSYLNTGDQRLLARTYDFTIIDAGKPVSYKSLGVGNARQYYTENVSKLEETKLIDFILTMIVFNVTDNMEYDESDTTFKYIRELAVFYKIDYEKIKKSVAEGLGITLS